LILVRTIYKDEGYLIIKQIFLRFIALGRKSMYLSALQRDRKQIYALVKAKKKT
jgi:hypothetical protein